MKFNYKYQVWWNEETGAVESCDHPDSMRPYDGNGGYKPCCNQYTLANHHIDDVQDGTFDHLLVTPIQVVIQ